MASAARRSSADTAAANGRSGRLLLRMPAPLHEELSRSAEREGVSLNQLIVRTLEASVDGKTTVASEPAPEMRTKSRLLGVALVANLVVVALAGAVAVGLLVLAWNS
jgi:HicB-like protein involved in pilus formation